MRQRCRKIALAGLGCALLALLVYAVLSSLGSGPGLSDPNPNGYYELVSAGTSVPAQVGDFRDLDQEGLRELVAKNAEALKRVRQALSGQCVVPVNSALTNFSIFSADLPKLKRLAQLLAAEGTLAEMEKRQMDAARSYVDAIRLGNAISRRGMLIHRLVGMAVEAIGSTPLGKLRSRLNPKQTHGIVAELQAIDKSRVTWTEVVESERRFMRQELWKTSPLNLPKGLWQGWRTSRSVEPRHNLALARVRLLTLELALGAYAAENGAPPKSLEELVPKYLEFVPNDPFTRKPLVYRPQGTNWLVYSVGENKTDDGGQRTGRGSGKGDVFFDSL